MKKIFCIALASISIGLAFVSLGAEREPEGGEATRRVAERKTVVARVNGTAITAEAVTEMMDRLRAGKGHGAEAPGKKDALRNEALDRVIIEELAYQKAKAGGQSAGPEEVNRKLEDLRGRMGGAEGLKKALEKEMRTEEKLLADIERDIVLRRIFAGEVSDKVAVSEEDLAREYERQKGKYVKPEKVVVDDIVFFLNPDESSSVARAEEIRRKVYEDGDRNPWNLSPDGTFIVHEIEIIREKQKELYEGAMKLKAGELSGVIKTWDSLHIIKLKEYSPMKQLSLDEVRGSLQRKLVAEARKVRLRQWEAELRKGATIEIADTAGKKQ